jgi:apolipoprotein D and lipocalin family protein
MSGLRLISVRAFLAVVVVGMLNACTGIPPNVVPVRDFELNRYLGKWYEIARLDHSFERGMQQVSAEYSLREDGGVQVVNRGFSTSKNEWKNIEGKAYFVGSEAEGHLKVSFFGPFYSSYIVFELDKQNYEYACVSGNSTSYLWLLSRTPVVSEDIISRFKARAAELGFDTDKLIFVEHD